MNVAKDIKNFNMFKVKKPIRYLIRCKKLVKENF